MQLRANKIGSECFRLWKACDAQVGDDFQINPQEIESRYFGVLTKLFNVARFASQFDAPINFQTPPEELPIEDRWILSEFDGMMRQVEAAWGDIDIYTAAQTLKGFGTGVFPSHWLEMAKSRLYDGDSRAAWTLHRIVRDLLTGLSPICPFFTHYLSTELYGESSIDIRQFPLLDDGLLGDDAERLRSLTNYISEFNSSVWKAKKDAGLSLKSPISDFKIPSELSELSEPLIGMHALEFS